MDEVEFAAWVDRVAEGVPETIEAWGVDTDVFEMAIQYPPGFASPREYELANEELARRGLRVHVGEQHPEDVMRRP